MTFGIDEKWLRRAARWVWWCIQVCYFLKTEVVDAKRLESNPDVSSQTAAQSDLCREPLNALRGAPLLEIVV